MEYMIDQLDHRGGTYIEPFAGGAGIAIELLQSLLAFFLDTFAFTLESYPNTP